MKTSKKSKVVAILAILLMLGLNTYEVNAAWYKPWTWGIFNRHSHVNHNPSHGGNTVGAPLDGGILTLLLGGAGAAYYVRKKKKNSAAN